MSKPNRDLDRAIQTFMDLDRSLTSGRRAGFSDISSVKSDSSDAKVLIEEPVLQSKKGGDEILLNVLLDSCINCNQVDTALELFESLDSTSFFKPDEVTFNTLIKGCAIDKRLDRALLLFDQMRSSAFNLRPNDVTFNSLIDVCVRCGHSDKAWALFHQMSKEGLKPDNYTCSTLVKGVMPDQAYWHIFSR
jgi:pentatricopeptide repeat protein